MKRVAITIKERSGAISITSEIRPGRATVGENLAARKIQEIVGDQTSGIETAVNSQIREMLGIEVPEGIPDVPPDDSETADSETTDQEELTEEKAPAPAAKPAGNKTGTVWTGSEY